MGVRRMGRVARVAREVGTVPGAREGTAGDLMALRSFRTTALVLGLMNIVFACIAASAALLWIPLEILGRWDAYRLLDLNGAIDHSQLARLWGAEYADTWTMVASRLCGHGGDVATSWFELATVAFALNGLVLCVTWYLCRRQDRTTAKALTAEPPGGTVMAGARPPEDRSPSGASSGPAG